MLKKIVITGAVAVLGLLGVAGAAYADSGAPDCSSHEKHSQENSGDQLVGGNFNLEDVTAGVISGAIDKPAICPAVGNNNEINLGK